MRQTLFPLDKPLKGNCLCQKIGFSLKNAVEWVANCHCSICRQAHGAAYVTWAGVKKQNFTLDKGQQYLGKYHSSAKAIRTFCKNCGSPLFFQSTRWPDEIHIARALLPDHIGLKPTIHCFFNNKAVWLDIHDHLPQDQENSGDGDPEVTS